MRIKIDSREQQPYEFQSPSEVGTVPLGDYSICGLENHIAILANGRYRCFPDCERQEETLSSSV